MDADERKTGLYLLQALSRLGTAKLSPPQLVSDWKTTYPTTKKKAAGEWQTGLYVLHDLSRVVADELSPPLLVSAWKTTNLQLKNGSR